MKNRIALFLALLYLSYSSQAQNTAQKVKDSLEIRAIWDQFLSAVSQNDKVAFQQLSASHIRCYDCLENTLRERKELDILESKKNWYFLHYSNTANIPIRKFVLQDFDLVFSPDIIDKMLNNETKFLRRQSEDDLTTYEVLVTVIVPSPTYEGAQYVFGFTKKEKHFKFDDISTVP